MLSFQFSLSSVGETKRVAWNQVTTVREWRDYRFIAVAHKIGKDKGRVAGGIAWWSLIVSLMSTLKCQLS